MMSADGVGQVVCTVVRSWRGLVFIQGAASGEFRDVSMKGEGGDSSVVAGLKCTD